MSVDIQTISELQDRILNDYATELGVDKSDLGDTYIVRSKVLAGLVYPIYLALSSVEKNIFFDLAEESILKRYGNVFLQRNPAPASQGIYTVEVTGTIGAKIPASTQFQANDTTNAAGFLFIVDNEKTLTAEIENVTIRALTAGLNSALNVNDLLTSVSPIAGINDEVKVISIDTQPSAAEDIENYRDDIVEAVRLEANGGSPADYKLWASDVPEVRTVYPYVIEGEAGNLEIFIEATKENSAPAEIIGVPTQQTIDDVYKNDVGSETGALIYDSVNNRGRKPMTVNKIEVKPVNPIPVDIRFIELSDESIANQLRSSIDDLLYEIRPFIAGADNLVNKNNILTISAIQVIVINILANNNITYTDLKMDVNSIESTLVEFDKGDYPYLNLIKNNGNPI